MEVGPHTPGAAHRNYPKGSWEELMPLPHYKNEMKNCPLPPKRKPMALLNVTLKWTNPPFPFSERSGLDELVTERATLKEMIVYAE